MTSKFNTFLCLWLFIFANLTGCATTYRPMKKADGPGYSDEKIDDKNFRITFRANDKTKIEDLENYFLRRSAEVTVKNNYTFFTIVDSETITELPKVQKNVPIIKGNGNPSVTLSPATDVPIRPSYRQDEFKRTSNKTITGEIKLYKKGTEPPNAYNADDILQSVQL